MNEKKERFSCHLSHMKINCLVMYIIFCGTKISMNKNIKEPNFDTTQYYIFGLVIEDDSIRSFSCCSEILDSGKQQTTVNVVTSRHGIDTFIVSIGDK